jgi:DNA invertase Pin-like site-specific DNA recombinase
MLVTTHKGQRIGYIRVSSFAQNTERQLDGIELDEVFTDKVSGKDTDRPALADLLKHTRAGDTVLVHSMDRLARNLDDLRRLVRELTEKQIRVEFVKEGLTFTGEDSPIQELLMNVIGSVAMFERALIKERQMEGIKNALKKGVKFGAQQKLSEEQVKEIKQRVAQGDQKKALAEEYGVSRQTLYTALSRA